MSVQREPRRVEVATTDREITAQAGAVLLPNSIFLRVDQDEPGTVTGTMISGTRHEGTYFSYEVSWTVTRIS